MFSFGWVDRRGMVVWMEAWAWMLIVQQKARERWLKEIHEHTRSEDKNAHTPQMLRYKVAPSIASFLLL